MVLPLIYAYCAVCSPPHVIASKTSFISKFKDLINHQSVITRGYRQTQTPRNAFKMRPPAIIYSTNMLTAFIH